MPLISHEKIHNAAKILVYRLCEWTDEIIQHYSCTTMKYMSHVHCSTHAEVCNFKQKSEGYFLWTIIYILHITQTF